MVVFDRYLTELTHYSFSPQQKLVCLLHVIWICMSVDKEKK